MRNWHKFVVSGVAAVATVFPLSAARPANAPTSAAPLSVLIVGGGPRPDYNQVAIESNVRYVSTLLPASAPKRVLFADGNPASPTVQYEAPAPEIAPAEAAFRLLFEPKKSGAVTLKYRASVLKQVDGPAQKPAIDAEVSRIASGNGPVFLYFTGHGSPNRRNLDNNIYALWSPTPQDSNLSVKELAQNLAKIPADRPVAVVMVQCYSGSFGNLLFEGGDPLGKLLERPFCGFFATTRERVAAGCTPEINEANYHDFTSYFFAALSGRDRTGKSVNSADFDRNGVVGMNEAFYYALMTEPSIDVPVCTSDVFLRRFVPVSDDDIANTPYSEVLQSASLAQRAALEGLSKALGASGEDRLKTALADVRSRVGGNRVPTRTAAHDVSDTQREARELQSKVRVWREELLKQYPALKDKNESPEYNAARREAVAYLAGNERARKELLQAAAVFGKASAEAFEDELRGARFLRLMRVAKTALLEKKLRASGDTALIAQFDRLRLLESRNPLRS